LNDSEFEELWGSANRYYLVASQEGADRIESLVGKERFQMVASSGGKLLLTNIGAKNPAGALPTARRPTVASSFAVPGPGSSAQD
jgi:hypothetical protein